MKLYIKYRVSLRCKLTVKEELSKLGLRYAGSSLGMVEVVEDLTPEQYIFLQDRLFESGMELLGQEETLLVERIKSLVIEMVKYADELRKEDYQDHISGKLGHDFGYLSNLFSEVTGVTIPKFIVIQKIERIKELLFYYNMNLGEVASKLGYRNVAQMSSEFKRMTGLSPTFYQQLKQKREEALNKEEPLNKY
jgi:AraC-like DNA-binding protein